MLRSSSSSTDFLSEVETTLSRGPVDESAELRDIPDRLSRLMNNNEVDIAEKTVQLLGTAVGQQS